MLKSNVGNRKIIIDHIIQKTKGSIIKIIIEITNSKTRDQKLLIIYINRWFFNYLII